MRFPTGAGRPHLFAIAPALAVLLCAVDPCVAHAEGEARAVLGEAVEVALDCDLRQCDRAPFVETILAVGGIEVGDVVDSETMARAESRLLATGFFTDVGHRIDATEGGVRVVFTAAGATVIRNVRVRAGAALGSELRRRIFLRSGEVWTGDQRIVDRQAREIVEYFEDQGYFGTDVDIEARAAGDHVVDLVVRVDRGRRKTVDRVYVRGHEAMSYEEIESILLGRLNLTRTFTVRRFEEAQEALIARYRELGYIQARIAYDDHRIAEDSNSVDLFVEIREGPVWEIVFNGNTLFTDNELLDTVTFYQTGFIDEAEIAIAVEEIQARYETIGHFFADVGVRYSSSPGGLQRLAFDIVERETAEVDAIRFSGVEALDPSDLRAVMETSEYDILSTGGYLQRSRLDQDVTRIEALYRSNGFLQAKVARVVLVGEDEGRDLTLTVHVIEGPRTTVSAVDVDGWDETEELRLERDLRQQRRRNFGRRESTVPFDPTRLRDEQSAILARLHERGYAFATIDTECFVDGSTSPVACTPAEVAPGRSLEAADRDAACERIQRGGRIIEECRFVSPGADTAPVDGVRGSEVEVRHHLEPGRRITFAHLLVRGNFRTRGTTVSREMNFRYGEPYDVGVLLEGQSRLRALGLFDSVRVSTLGAEPDPTTGDANHVVVQLEESGSRYLEHRVSLEARATTAQNFLLVLSNEPTFRDINIGGRAKELRLFGNFDLDVLDPGRLALNEFRAGAGIRYIARRFYVSRRQTDPWEAQAQLAYDYDLLAVAPAPLTRELAFDARVREESDAIEGLFFELGLNLSRTETLDQSDPLVESDVFDPALILSVAPRITFDRRRDNPLNPNRGFFAELEVEVADDFIGVLDSERFTKFTTRTSGFIPLGRGFVLGLNGRFGAAVGGVLSGFESGGRFALPLSERYSLGGVTTLRGFAEGGVSSLDTDEFGGDFVVNGNIELRYPFLRGIGLDAAVFFDAGQLMADLSDFRMDEFRMTAGMGLRWIVADLIPIVFDYGAVLGRRPGEGFGRLHFNVGYTF